MLFFCFQLYNKGRNYKNFVIILTKISRMQNLSKVERVNVVENLMRPKNITNMVIKVILKRLNVPISKRYFSEY